VRLRDGVIESDKPNDHIRAVNPPEGQLG